MGLQHVQREILDLIIELRAKPTTMPAAPATELVSDRPNQGFKPTNTDNLSTTGQPISIVKEPATLLTHSDLEVLMKQEKDSPVTMDW